MVPVHCSHSTSAHVHDNENLYCQYLLNLLSFLKIQKKIKVNYIIDNFLKIKKIE
jgi:hypothetical protein